MIHTEKNGSYLKLIIPELWEGLTIEQLLIEIWQLPKKTVHQIRMEKSILVNGKNAPFSFSLKSNDELSIKMFTESDYGVVPTPMDIEILYEDDHLLIANKPAGITTHPNEPKDTHTLANGIAYYLQQKGEICKVQHVHRLDKDTTGAILFAKPSFIGRILDKMLLERKISRVYTALVTGKVKNVKGTIHAKIGRDRHHPTRRRVSPTGQDAITHYKVIDYYPKFNLTQVLCKLDTGRTHQIRVHFSHIGHPLAGDTLYGGKPIFKRQALHAKFLSFTHPITLENIKVEAPYLDTPEIFKK